jgi:hypothetical protein
MAMGSACVSRADLFKEDEDARKGELNNARVYFLQALAYNKDIKNPRVSAICYIRLGLICLSDKETFAEARHWHDKWVGIKQDVHHEFCHQMGTDLERKVRNLGGITYLLIDPAQSIEYDYWLKHFNNFFKNQAIYRVVKELSRTSADDESADGDSSMALDRKDIRREFVRVLREEVKLKRNKAYEWADEPGLETRLTELLRQ